jgi:hypothetical protein
MAYFPAIFDDKFTRGIEITHGKKARNGLGAVRVFKTTKTRQYGKLIREEGVYEKAPARSATTMGGSRGMLKALVTTTSAEKTAVRLISLVVDLRNPLSHLSFVFSRGEVII